MVLISHRGNLNGRIIERENHPEYIDEAINFGFDVEIDIWVVDGILHLGHDKPQYQIDEEWLNNRYERLWIHCKNIEAMEWCNLNGNFNYFWHEKDTVTLTSMNVLWAFPGKQPIKGSIAVIPEIFNDKLDSCIGVCSDYIENYK